MCIYGQRTCNSCKEAEASGGDPEKIGWITNKCFESRFKLSHGPKWWNLCAIIGNFHFISICINYYNKQSESIA